MQDGSHLPAIRDALCGGASDVLVVGGDEEAVRREVEAFCWAPTADERVPLLELGPDPRSERRCLLAGEPTRPQALPLGGGALVWIGDVLAWRPGAALSALRRAQEARDGVLCEQARPAPSFRLVAWARKVDLELYWHDTHGLRFGRIVALEDGSVLAPAHEVVAP